MAINSAIEWTEATWNPITGCTKFSRGCINCYAKRMARRLAGRYGYPEDDPFRLTLHPSRLSQPLGWKGNHIIFVCSMSDVFHDDVPSGYIDQILEVIEKCPRHIFQILTKRAERLLEISRQIGEWPENAWIGVTVEANEYKQRIDLLRQIKASIRFLSCEPLLDDLGILNLEKIDWVIVGGESGWNSRPMHSEWAASIRDQCLTRNIPYFFKQWGGSNKKAAGRRLQGKEWSQMPMIPANHEIRTIQ